MRIRQGRKNKHNLYLQVANVPSDDDVCLGLIISPDVAEKIALVVNNVEAFGATAPELIADTLGIL